MVGQYFRIYFGETSAIKFSNNFTKAFGGALFSMKKSTTMFGEGRHHCYISKQ